MLATELFLHKNQRVKLTVIRRIKTETNGWAYPALYDIRSLHRTALGQVAQWWKAGSIIWLNDGRLCAFRHTNPWQTHFQLWNHCPPPPLATMLICTNNNIWLAGFSDNVFFKNRGYDYVLGSIEFKTKHSPLTPLLPLYSCNPLDNCERPAFSTLCPL